MQIALVDRNFDTQVWGQKKLYLIVLILLNIRTCFLTTYHSKSTKTTKIPFFHPSNMCALFNFRLFNPSIRFLLRKKSEITRKKPKCWPHVIGPAHQPQPINFLHLSRVSRGLLHLEEETRFSLCQILKRTRFIQENGPFVGANMCTWFSAW